MSHTVTACHRVVVRRRAEQEGAVPSRHAARHLLPNGVDTEQMLIDFDALRCAVLLQVSVVRP